MTEEKRTAADVPLPGGDFRLFVTRLSYQLMMSCGLLENPMTGKRDKHPDNARMLISDLKMIQAKTVGNLSDDEQEHIDKILRDMGPVVEAL